MNNIIISLDGHSGCGKSTLAKLISNHLKFTYIDTGAMYRALTLYFFQNNLINNDNTLKENFPDFLNKLNVDFSKSDKNGKSWVRLNEVVVEKEIRSLKISNLVSHVSKNSKVRAKLISLQQDYGLKENVVMDGRDIGTVVFPNAQLKFWITASADKRAERRFIEFQKKGENVSYQQVLENIISRDNEDERRKVSPLVKPANAIEIDNSNLDILQTFEFALSHINKFLGD
jgi:cytidylate kinase